MRHPAATTQPLGQQNDTSPADDHAANEARAWLRRTLRWERRFAELGGERESAHTTPNSRTINPRPALPAPESATTRSAWWLRFLDRASRLPIRVPWKLGPHATEDFEGYSPTPR
jgi:hypothetical protein